MRRRAAWVLALTFAGLLYKQAVFPLHFWTPDVYQGASNETTSFVASLPKIGAVAVLVRLVSLATPENATIALLLTMLAVGSMFYGNLVALMQKDLKRLLGFSGIAHAGYALIGVVALDEAGYTAALYYVMEVGGGEVDAGGSHEALIGIGYTVGPLCGVFSCALVRAGWIAPEQREAAAADDHGDFDAKVQEVTAAVARMLRT